MISQRGVTRMHWASIVLMLIGCLILLIFGFDKSHDFVTINLWAGGFISLGGLIRMWANRLQAKIKIKEGTESC